MTASVFLVLGSCAAFSARVVSPDAQSLWNQAQKLREEAQVQERELRELQGKNNILPLAPEPEAVAVATPTWSTQIWIGGNDEARPAVRTTWHLLADGAAAVESSSASDHADHAPGWRLKEKNNVLECWCWLRLGRDEAPRKVTLTTSATSDADVEKLLGFEKDSREKLEAAKERLEASRALDTTAMNPFKKVFAMQERMAAIDGFEVATRVALEYEAYAERCHGAKFDLGGDVGELTLGPRGHVAAGRHDEGNFKAWASTRKA